MIDPTCVLLAALNAVVAWLNWRDFRHRMTAAGLWATASWLGSAAYWLARAVVSP